MPACLILLRLLRVAVLPFSQYHRWQPFPIYNRPHWPRFPTPADFAAYGVGRLLLGATVREFFDPKFHRIGRIFGWISWSP